MKVAPLLLTASLALSGSVSHAHPSAQSESAEEEQSIDFAFAPPIGTTLRYEHIRSGEQDGRVSGARLIYDYRFERRESGFLVWIELVEIEGLGDERRARLAETVAAPMLNIRYAIELAPNGEPLAIREEERVWASTLNGIALIEAEMRSRTGIGEEERAQMLALLTSVQNQESEARREGMLIVITDMIALAGRSVAIGEHPHDLEIASPLGDTVRMTGTMTAGIASPDMAVVEIAGNTDTAEHFTIRERTLFHAAPSSGLVHRVDRTRTFEAPAASDAPSYTERVVLRLLEEVPSAE